MGVVPGVSILCRPKLIGKSISLSNRALCNSIDTIHLVCVQLSDSVPVDSRAILIIIIPDVNNNLVTPACLNQRAGKLLVEDFPAGLLKSIRGQGHVSINLKEVFPNDACWNGVGMLIYGNCKRNDSGTQYMDTHS